MSKPNLYRGIADNGDGDVCANGPGLIGTTLCGFTDGLAHVDQSRPITCNACLSVISFIHGHRRPRNAKPNPNQ